MINQKIFLQHLCFHVIAFLIFTILSPLSMLHAQQPERIILNVTAQPATSMAVTWRTATEASDPKAEITIARAQPDLDEDALKFIPTSEWVSINEDQKVQYHSVVFTNLQPNTLYAYRVGDNDHWSPWNQFRTASVQPEPFKFVNFGDPQNDIYSLCSRVFRMAYTIAPDARFWHFVGDIVNHGDRDNEWGELYDAFGWIAQVTPMMLLPGNHGYPKVMNSLKKESHLNQFWRPQFTLPQNGPKGLEETVYFVDYQGVRLIMLNGNEMLEEQVVWLDSILADNPNRWTISAMHQPLYSTGRDRDNPKLQQLFGPIYDKYHVDLVLQGHDHTYGRTGKIFNGKLVGDNEQGTVYVVSVSGTKIYDLNPRYEKLMEKIGTGRQLFQVISATPKKLSYESWTANSELFDQFELKK
ncbi:metallophosphoesterase family protein [candidate division KSB1 bacterium]|nr:metallophosphoesterase family protein [candidate division KSB1 bacterium]